MPVIDGGKRVKIGLAVLAALWVTVVFASVTLFGERFIGPDATLSNSTVQFAESR